LAQHSLSEDDYQAVADWRTSERFSDRERVAIEYGERFVTDHTSLDDSFWARFRAEWDDAEILDLSVCIASFLGLGRMTQVLAPAHECRLEI
jgi:alkylhydroperoxidase family enzyme